MDEYIFTGKVALWSAAGAALFTIFLFVFWQFVSVGAVMMALACITVGAAVVGALINTSLGEHEEDH